MSTNFVICSFIRCHLLILKSFVIVFIFIAFFYRLLWTYATIIPYYLYIFEKFLVLSAFILKSNTVLFFPDLNQMQHAICHHKFKQHPSLRLAFPKPFFPCTPSICFFTCPLNSPKASLSFPLLFILHN